MRPEDVPNNDATTNLMSLRSPRDPITGAKTGPGLLESENGAQLAIGRIDNATHYVNKALADVGSYGNRLTHALENQRSMEHNIVAAESIIRDTDVATETAAWTKYQVMQKTAVSVLAQANSFPKDILSLLKIG